MDQFSCYVLSHFSAYVLLQDIALEHGSAKTNVNVKGLGRDWSWESYYNEFMANKEFEEAQLTFDQLFPDSPGGCICGAPCGCYDG